MSTQIIIRISGIRNGDIATVDHTLTVPEFELLTNQEFMGVFLPDVSIEQQQRDYVGDNYDDLVVKQAEKADIFPIFDFKIVKEKVKGRKAKNREKPSAEKDLLLKKQVIDFAVSKNDDKQFILDFCVVLELFWLDLKRKHTPVEIANLVLKIMVTSLKAALASHERITSGKTREEHSLLAVDNNDQN